MMMNSNIDLIVPAFIAFLVLRTKNILNVPLLLLNGLRYYSQSKSSSGVSPASAVKKGNTSFLDTLPAVKKFLEITQLEMLIIDGSQHSQRFLSSQVFFQSYENLVLLTITSVLCGIWSIFRQQQQLSVAETPSSSLWSTLFIIVSIFFAIQSSLQIVYLSGSNLVETKYALYTGVFVAIFSAVTLSYSHSIVYLATFHAALKGAIIHYLAVSSHFFPFLKDYLTSRSDLLYYVGVVYISFFIGIVAIGMVLPITRFTKTLVAITSNAGNFFQKESYLSVAMLWIDALLPLLVGIIYALSAINGNSYLYEMEILIFSGCLVVALRFYTMRSHLQSFLDTILKVVVSQYAILPEPQTHKILGLKSKVDSCNQYMVAAVAQYLFSPCILLSLLLLLTKCWFTAVADVTRASEIVINTTALAMRHDESSIYFGTIIDSLIASDSTGYQSQSTSLLLKEFLNKLAQMAPLPAQQSIVLLKAFIAFYLLISFIINTVCFVIAFQPTFKKALELSKKKSD